MNHFREALRVKVRSLAEEARIIRHEVNRLKSYEFKTPESIHKTRALNGHRTGIVRYEARHAQLASAFLRGKPYCVAERFAKEPPDSLRIFELASKFASIRDRDGRAQLATQISEWLGHQEIIPRLSRFALA